MEENRGNNVSKVHFLGGDQHDELQIWLEFYDHTLVLLSFSSLNAWEKVEESEKSFESFTKIMQRSFHSLFYKD